MADSSADISVGDVLCDAWAAAKARRRLVFATIALSSLAGIFFDIALEPDTAAAANGLFGLVSLYLQLLVTAALLDEFDLLPDRFDPRRPTLGRYPAAFGLSLLYLIGIAAGLLLLILPGLILIIRWSVSLPVMVAEDIGVVRALRRSWDLTAGKWRVVLRVYMLVLAAYLVPLALFLFTYPLYGSPSWPVAVAANVTLAAALALFWILAVALYRRLCASTAEH